MLFASPFDLAPHHRTTQHIAAFSGIIAEEAGTRAFQMEELAEWCAVSMCASIPLVHAA